MPIKPPRSGALFAIYNYDSIYLILTGLFYISFEFSNLLDWLLIPKVSMIMFLEQTLDYYNPRVLFNCAFFFDHSCQMFSLNKPHF